MRGNPNVVFNPILAVRVAFEGSQKNDGFLVNSEFSLHGPGYQNTRPCTWLQTSQFHRVPEVFLTHLEYKRHLVGKKEDVTSLVEGCEHHPPHLVDGIHDFCHTGTALEPSLRSVRLFLHAAVNLLTTLEAGQELTLINLLAQACQFGVEGGDGSVVEGWAKDGIVSHRVLSPL